MSKTNSITAISAMILSLAYFVGCNPTPPATSSGTTTEDHHDHDHDHEMGPNGGHVLELGDEEYHAEWLHDDDAGKVTVIILDSDAKDEVRIESSELTINTVIADTPKPYTLAATNTNDEDPPTSSRFEIVDPSLIVAIELGEGASVTLAVDINGTPYSSKIEHDDHDH